MLSPLVADQAYEVSVRLLVPRSDMNIALGMTLTFFLLTANTFARQATL